MTIQPFDSGPRERHVVQSIVAIVAGVVAVVAICWASSASR
jgi:hypothetical protein